jgi:hypothetical protein
MKIFQRGFLPPLNNDTKPIMVSYTLFGRICIHIFRGDVPFLHNHTFNYFTLILWGGYKETILEDGIEIEHDRRVGWWDIRDQHVFHKTKLKTNICVTLFLKSKEKRKNFQAIVDGELLNDIAYYKKIGYSRKQIVNLIKNIK